MNKTTLPKGLDLVFEYENALSECGVDAEEVDYDKLCKVREKFANRLDKLLSSSQKDKEKAVEDLKNEIIETALIEAGKEPDGKELWIKNADDLEKVLNYAFKESLKAKEK